jgi:DNA-binding winged helix-turn-helix (wHTH) protein/TolB-like protein
MARSEPSLHSIIVARVSVAVYEFGPFRFDGRERSLTRDGAPVPLPPKTADMLLVLLEHRGELLDKSRLLQLVWPDTFVEETGLARNISLLRKALGDETGEPLYIETIPKRGYRFIAPNAAPSAPVARRWWPAAAGGAVVLLAFTAYYLYIARVYWTPVRSVAVMRFTDLSAAAQPHLAEALAEAVSTELAELGEWRVIAPSAIFWPKVGTLSLADVALRYKADAVFDGNLTIDGGRLRLNVQARDPRIANVLWAHSYERPWSDAVTLEKDLGAAVAADFGAWSHSRRR